MTWKEELPTKAGKYVVQTKTKILGTINTLDATFNPNSKNKWSFNNQNFYRYLDETT